MDLSLILKRLAKCLGILLAILVLGLFVLYPFWGRFAIMSGLVSGPYDHPGSVWASDDPEIVLEVSLSGSVESSECYVVSDGSKIDVSIIAKPDRPWVFITPKNNSHVYLMEGKLTQCTSDKLVFEVVEDKLFFGEYKSITLIRQN